MIDKPVAEVKTLFDMSKKCDYLLRYTPRLTHYFTLYVFCEDMFGNSRATEICTIIM